MHVYSKYMIYSIINKHDFNILYKFLIKNISIIILNDKNKF